MRTSMRALAALAAGAALAAAGCGDDSSTGGVSFEPHRTFQATCDTSASAGVCTTYVSGFSADALASSRTMCSASGWSTSTPCPAAGRIGRCRRTQGGVLENAYYPGFGSAAPDLAMGCLNLGGSWTAN
jgi:hypothetical protein